MPRTVGEIYQFLQNLVGKRAKEYGFTAGTPTSPGDGSTQPVTPLVPEGDSGTQPTTQQPSTNTTANTPPVTNVPKTPTTTDMTNGFVPTSKTVSSQPEVDFSKNSDVLQKSLEVQTSMDTTLKNILNKISELQGLKSSTTQTGTTEQPKEQPKTLDSPEAVIDLTKKRF